MAKSYRNRKHKITKNRRSGKRKRYTNKKRHTRRNRRGGNEMISGLSNPIYSKNFGSNQATEAAKRSNQGIPNANPFGSQTLISTTLPTMSKYTDRK